MDGDDNNGRIITLYQLVVTTHLQTSCFNELLDLTTSNQEDGTVGLKQWPGGQQEWDKVTTNILKLALLEGDNCLKGIFSNIYNQSR